MTGFAGLRCKRRRVVFMSISLLSINICGFFCFILIREKYRPDRPSIMMPGALSARELNVNLFGQRSRGTSMVSTPRPKQPLMRDGIQCALNSDQMPLQLFSGGLGTREGGQQFSENAFLLEEPGKTVPSLENVDIGYLPIKKDASYVSSACPKTLHTIVNYSSWFRERYEPGIKLFADFDDVRNYTNYRKTEHYPLPFGYAGVKRNQLADIFRNPNFTNHPIFPSGCRPRCIRCAVVGCGGILNGSNAGAEIDSHDLVFRLNSALSSGRFKKDVGSKTSIYTFFPESMHAADVTDKNAAYVYMPFKQYDLDYLENMVTMPTPHIPVNRLKVVHPDFGRYVYVRFLGKKAWRPTTGAMVVMMSVHICDEVTIYGFGYDPRFTLHYYDESFVAHTNESTASHDIHKERGLWNKLHEEGVIRFFKRDLW